MNIRNILFRTKDRWVNGGQVYRNLRQIEDAFSNRSNVHFNQEKISDLIAYASNNIPFYRHIKEDAEISDIPVVNKSIMRANLVEFINSKNQHKYKKVSTSGSTGTPFTSFQDQAKIARNTADTIFFASLVGYTLGEKLLYIKLWNAANFKPVWKNIVQNIECIDVTNQSAAYIKRTTVKAFKRSKKIHMLAYASYYDQLLKYLQERDLTVNNVGSALAMSEGMSLNTQKQLKRYLNVEVFSRYSNVENGIIAQQVPGTNGRFLVNKYSYFVELLDLESDTPVPNGQLGRIVVTDLYNRAMPFLRYDTGDLAVMEFDSTDKNYYFTEVQGRKMDLVFDTKGRPVSPLTINNNMLLFPEVFQYQFIQKSESHYQFLLNVASEKYSREDELLSFFQNIFGKDAELSVDYVTELPVLSSGKRKQVINLSEDK